MMPETSGQSQPPSTPPARIALRIEELVLHGFALSDRHRIGAAVEAELARLLAEYGMPESWSQSAEAAWLDAGSFTLAPNARADRIGTQVARAVYLSLSGGTGDRMSGSASDHSGIAERASVERPGGSAR